MKQLNWYQIFGQSHTIPDGSTVTPTDDVQILLNCANIWDKAYTTIADLLSDTTSLLAVIVDNNAINYLVRSTTFASSVTADATAMTDIGGDNYASNTLLGDSTWCTAICNSAYFESVLNVKVPTMTSNTTPSGECFAIASHNPPYYAFDNNNSTYWLAGVGYESPTDVYVGYSFDTAVKCYMALITPRQNLSAIYRIQSSSDKATWGNLTEDKTIPANTQNYKYIFASNNAARHYRAYGHSVGSGYDSQVIALQFYGRADV